MPTSARSSRPLHVSGRRARAAAASASIALLAAIAIANLTTTLKWSFKEIPLKEGVGGAAQTKNHSSQNRDDENCRALTLHEQGHWQHHYNNISSSMMSILNASKSISALYLPAEIEWLMGKNLPQSWDKCRGQRGLMYQTGLGNQCGACAVHGFRPSFSEWRVQNNDGTASNANDDSNAETHHGSPSLRLIERLARANQTLCLVGDSIDFQIYDALRYNLIRQQRLQGEFTINIESKAIPVNYSSVGWHPPYHGFMTMNEIKETVVSLLQHNGHDESRLFNSTFRYYKMYGWSPWNTAFMEDCNVVVLNIALHYDARGQMRGIHWGKPRLMDDIQGAITYLADFASTTATENRIAVWRSALPQHFNTTDRHYKPKKSCSLERLDEKVNQKYNEAYEVGFSKLCSNQTQSCRNRREHTCTVNRTNLDYRTVYKFLVEPSVFKASDISYHTSNSYRERFEQYVTRETIVTGKILRWNIANLFDQPTWHFANGDCSHFCYVPPMFEAAFQRLDLLLPSF